MAKLPDRSDIVGLVACCLPHPFTHQLGCHLWSRNDLSRRFLAGRQNLQMSPTHVDHKNPLSHSSLPVFSHFPLKHCHHLPRSIDAKQRRSFAPSWSVGQTRMRIPTELDAILGNTLILCCVGLASCSFVPSVPKSDLQDLIGSGNETPAATASTFDHFPARIFI